MVFGLDALHPEAASAQIEGALPRATQLPGSVRAMGMGDAYQMGSGHADALFYNPALLTSARGFGLEVQRWGPAGSASAASAALQWLGGGVGIGLRTLQFAAGGVGSLAAPAGQDDLFEVGSTPASERVATLAYAREGFAGIDLGVAISLVDERVGGEQHTVTLFDVGASTDVGPVILGLTVHELGTKPVLDSGDGPSRVSLGAGNYGQQIGPLDFGFAAKVGLDDDEVTYGGGVEVGYWPVQGRTFVARLGIEDVPDGSDALPLTTGFAYWGDNLTLEWAYRPVSDADEGGTHRFGVRWR